MDYFLARYYSSVQGRFTGPDEFTGGPDELFWFSLNASANPTFYADLTKPGSLNKYQYCFNNPLRHVDPDGHESEQPDPPQDPVIVIRKGLPPVTVPAGPTTKGPTDQQIVDGIQKVWQLPDPYLYPISQTIGTAPDPTIPVVPVPEIKDLAQPLPPTNRQPLPPPPPIQQQKQTVKTATRSPGGVTPGTTVSDKQAANHLKSGGDTISSSRAKAREVAKKASGGGQVVHHKPHQTGYRPHYHDKKHKNGHSFY